MILRIKDSDFSKFAGYKYTSSDCNTKLDKYINLFNENYDIHYFQIEDKTGNSLDFHTICYIKDHLHPYDKTKVGMFTKTEMDVNGKIEGYCLCFYKYIN